jgi:hypothetical protein
MDLKILLLLVLALSLFGCCIAPPETKGGSEGSTIVNGGTSGGDTVVVEYNTSGGMSDPSKCRNLPPQQMADCLEQSMGN